MCAVIRLRDLRQINELLTLVSVKTLFPLHIRIAMQRVIFAQKIVHLFSYLIVVTALQKYTHLFLLSLFFPVFLAGHTHIQTHTHSLQLVYLAVTVCNLRRE